MGIGSGLMATLNEDSKNWMQVLYLIIGGMGIGISIQTVLLAGQVSVPKKYLSQVTAISTFCQTLGAIFGIGICSIIFNNQLLKNIDSSIESYNVTLPGNLTSSFIAQSPEFTFLLLNDLPTQQAAVIHGYVKTLNLVFMLGIPFSALMLIATFFVKKDRITGDVEIPVGA
jgi:lipid-binding SYLF domain-containing protein